jgi:hypothetical protein
MLRFVQQILQVLLPDRGPGMRSVAVGLLRSWQQSEFSVLHLFDLTLGDAQFRRINKVVG